MYGHVYTHTCTYIHIYMHEHTYICIHIQYVQIYIYIHIYMFAQLYDHFPQNNGATERVKTYFLLCWSRECLRVVGDFNK